MVAGVRRIALVVLLMLSALPVVGALRAVTADAQTELIANPSVETAASGSTTLPASWAQGRWGTNTTTFAWATTGHTGSRSLSVNMTARSSGDAKWYFTPVTVAPSTAYVFSDWYKSTAPTQLTAEIRSTTGALSYIWLGDLPAAANWTQATGTFTTPANAAAVTVFHLIAAVGTLQTDDFSLATAGPPPAPTVTVTAPAAGADSVRRRRAADRHGHRARQQCGRRAVQGRRHQRGR